MSTDSKSSLEYFNFMISIYLTAEEQPISWTIKHIMMFFVIT
ncbi:hypothetical protein H374_7080 [Rickettsia prowazekii str. NMRC Madrid E]|nr:hypothetical protein H374_7080 [Rickettsia prowazekii str. NMRC Madrid E]